MASKLPLQSSDNANVAKAPASSRAAGRTIEQMYQVYENEEMVCRPVTYVPGLYKIFDEILVNLADNKQRDPSMDSIKVVTDFEKNLISVCNRGDGSLCLLSAAFTRISSKINKVIRRKVLASKTKIYMVLECFTGGDLFDRIVSKGRLSETEGRKMFQQLIDGISYCHNKGVFHRDLKLENLLLDAKGHIKITDFGLSALPQHFREDGLLHTTCGSPNYVAPEVLANNGYDGSASDIWSCGVILYVILTGCLPFDDTNLAVLIRKIFKGDPPIPRWISPGAKTMIKRMLDPNPVTRMTIANIKANDWFKHDYTPINCNDDYDAFSNQEDESVEEKSPDSPTVINAFQLIGMSSFLDLSGFFEKEKVSERQTRFTSNMLAIDLLEKIETIFTEMGFCLQKKHTRLKAIKEESTRKGQCCLSVTAEVFEISPFLNVVELRKLHGDSSLYKQLYERLVKELGSSSQVQELIT